MGRMIVLLVVLFALGCNSPRGNVVIFVASPEIMDDANAAAEEWNACGKRQIILVEKATKHSIPLRSTNDTIYNDRNEVVEGYTTFTDDEPTGITFNPLKPYVRLIIAHEMGHTLVGEVHFGPGIMLSDQKEPPSPDTVVTAEDCTHILE